MLLGYWLVGGIPALVFWFYNLSTVHGPQSTEVPQHGLPTSSFLLQSPISLHLKLGPLCVGLRVFHPIMHESHAPQAIFFAGKIQPFFFGSAPFLLRRKAAGKIPVKVGKGLNITFRMSRWGTGVFSCKGRK